MRNLIVFCILFFLTFPAFSTGQAGDIILWKSEKLELFSNPLESYPGFDKIRDTLKNPVRVTLLFSTSETNKPEIRILKGSGIKFYDDEALRAAAMIPDWDVYIRKGKVLKLYWSVPIIFDNQKKLKYSN